MAHRASDAPKRKVIDDNSDDEIDEALFATAQQHAATSTTTVEHNDDEGADDDVDDKLAVRRIAKPALKDDADLQAAHADFESVLRLYYQMLFPFKPMYDWLSYGDGETRCASLAARNRQRRPTLFFFFFLLFFGSQPQSFRIASCRTR